MVCSLGPFFCEKDDDDDDDDNSKIFCGFC
jgi:hypothetical protein